MNRSRGHLASSLALLFAASLPLGACMGNGDPAEEISEARADLLYVAPPNDPNIHASCVGTGTMERHNPRWPHGEDGVCSATPAYTTDDAVLACDGRDLKYFGYYCGDYWDNTSGWTSYFACCCSPTTILFETRYFPPQSADVTSYQEAQTRFAQLAGGPGYGSTMLADTGKFSNHFTFPGGVTNNIAYHLAVTLFVKAADAGEWQFRLGADYGRGGALMIDGVRLTQSFPPFPGGIDFNWPGTFTNVNPDLILQGSRTLDAGVHVIESYGFENGSDELYAPFMCKPGQPDQNPRTCPMEPVYQFRFEAKPPGGEWAPIAAQADPLCH